MLILFIISLLRASNLFLLDFVLISSTITLKEFVFPNSRTSTVSLSSYFLLRRNLFFFNSEFPLRVRSEGLKKIAFYSGKVLIVSCFICNGLDTCNSNVDNKTTTENTSNGVSKIKINMNNVSPENVGEMVTQ